MAIPATQREVADFLAAITGQGMVETHISAVFLGRDEVLKLKKAVDFGFLDFSSLAERGRLIAHEQALNAPAAPGLYLGPVAITRGQDGALALGGAGQVVDWVLRMRRLPADAFLDAHAPLDGPGLDALADTVVALHQAAPPRTASDPGRMLEGNRQSGLSAGLPPEAVEAWGQAAAARLQALTPWLASRRAFQRRCHGDLHLGNLCLINGRPTPFDALEFSEDLASIDTGYDLAFLLMDLDQRWGRAAANRVMNRYIARSGDVGLLRGLPLWLSMRAFIRAHVSARSGDDAKALLTASLAYLNPPPPRLVAIGGLQGSGKSTLARALAPGLGAAPGALVLRSDELRKRRAGIAPETPLPPAAYSAEESAAVFATLRAEAAEALAAGHAVVADAVFQRVAERDALAALFTPFQGFWLEAPLSVLQARIEARQNDASDADLAVLQATAARGCGPIDWARLDATKDAEAQARKMLLDAPPAASP